MRFNSLMENMENFQLVFLCNDDKTMSHKIFYFSIFSLITFGDYFKVEVDTKCSFIESFP